MTRPNILLITSDQQHVSTLGAVNPRIRTPALDRLCREGTRFDRAYCVNPTCTPTRASIITGLYPSQHGAWSLGTKLFEDVPTLGDLLAEAGYDTTLVGKAHFQPTRSRYGLESVESLPLVRDLAFWRDFRGPWYGFRNVEIARMHGSEYLVGQHYALWMEEKGFSEWRDHFEDWPPNREKARALRASRSWSLPEEFHYTTWTGERTVARIEQAADEGRPFFAWASFHDPHPPYIVPEPWASMYDPEDMEPGMLREGEHDANSEHFRKTQERDPAYWQRVRQGEAIHGGHTHLHDRDELKKNMAAYYGMTSFMDREIGRILDCLDRRGLADNTLVVFTTDHGHFLGQHGLIAKAVHHYEDLLRIPFIVRYPGRVEAGAVRSDLQNLVDLAPTFLAAAGVEVPCHMTGLNQWANWSEGVPGRTWSITENHHGTHHFHMRSFVTDRYKLTVYRDGADGELFDLQEDPDEVRNLWHNPAVAALKGDLFHRFLQACLQSEQTRMPRIAGA